MKNRPKEIIKRSWGNTLFAGSIFLGFGIMGFLGGMYGEISFLSAKFFLVWIMAFVGFFVGILFLTSFTWSYIDYNEKAIIQKGRTLIFFPDSENSVYVSLEDIAKIEIQTRGLSHGTEFTPVIYTHKGEKHKLDSTEIKRRAIKIVGKIRLAVIHETGKEPIVKIPTKEEIDSLP